MPSPSSSFSLTKSRARRDQLFASVLGILFLGISIAIRPLLSYQRSQLVQESETSLRSLAVNFPRLTLGGFRGLIATWLWTQAEQDKADRKWMDLETKYDIIGSLQPYFTSVYIFHSWNQAYNLSAQWHDQDAKYKWVLDGLAYLNKGEDYNPQNPDIIVEQGNMFFLKLGGAFERHFYRGHWRDDMSRFWQLKYMDPPLPTNEKTESLKLVHEAVLRVPPENKDAYDKAADPLEQQKLRTFKTAELLDPSRITTRAGYGISIIAPELFDQRTDGLPAADPMPFRYGVSPFYFSYIEFRRAGDIANTRHIIPTTTTMRIVDAWPAMSLRLWCRDDLYYTETRMAELFGPMNAIASIDASDLRDNIAEMQDCYRNISLLAPKAVADFTRHLRDYPINNSIHPKHIKETLAYEAQGKAESQLLKALLIWHVNGRKLGGPGVSEAFTKTLAALQEAIDVTTAWVDFMYPVKEGQPFPFDRNDFQVYVNSLNNRRIGIERLLKTPPDQQPDMSFLLDHTVER